MLGCVAQPPAQPHGPIREATDVTNEMAAVIRARLGTYQRSHANELGPSLSVSKPVRTAAAPELCGLRRATPAGCCAMARSNAQRQKESTKTATHQRRRAPHLQPQGQGSALCRDWSSTQAFGQTKPVRDDDHRRPTAQNPWRETCVSATSSSGKAQSGFGCSVAKSGARHSPRFPAARSAIAHV